MAHLVPGARFREGSLGAISPVTKWIVGQLQTRERQKEYLENEGEDWNSNINSIITSIKDTTDENKQQNQLAFARFATHFNRLNLANILVCEGDSEGEKQQPRIIASEGGVQDAGKRGSTQDASANQKFRHRLVHSRSAPAAVPTNSATKRKTKIRPSLTSECTTRHGVQPSKQGSHHCPLSTNATASSWPFGHRCWVAVLLVSRAL